MIYLFIFIYLLFLSIHYDILENKKYKWIHFKIVITLLILVAGLRWRIGTDTVVYAKEFVNCHDLFHLELSDFDSLDRMPLWVLLNIFCKTIWNNFVFVQLVVAAFSLSIVGYFIKKISPSLCFYVLLCYFVSGQYFVMNMELLRESMAVGFYFLMLLSINKNSFKLAVVYAFLSVMFHVFALFAIIIFLIFYYLIPRSVVLYLNICIVFLCIIVFDNNLLVSFVQYVCSFFYVNNNFVLTILNYALSDKYGVVDRSFVKYLSLFIFVFSYVYMLYKCNRKIYNKYVKLKWDLFRTLIFLSVILLICKFSFVIIFRIQSSYNYFFTCLLSVVFCKGILLDCINLKQRVFVYLLLLLVPLILAFRTYLSYDSLYDSYHWYVRYYPYSSIFDKTIDPKREKHHDFRNGGYSIENNY